VLVELLARPLLFANALVIINNLSMACFRSVLYVGLFARGELRVPNLHCTRCGDFEVPPELIGCWPSNHAPGTGSVWYDVQVLRLFHCLRNDAGLSASNFVATISGTHDGLGTANAPSLDASVFSTAYKYVCSYFLLVMGPLCAQRVLPRRSSCYVAERHVGQATNTTPCFCSCCRYWLVATRPLDDGLAAVAGAEDFKPGVAGHCHAGAAAAGVWHGQQLSA
jgi:hypothetical protein